jgi:hypothetical protein
MQSALLARKKCAEFDDDNAARRDPLTSLAKVPKNHGPSSGSSNWIIKQTLCFSAHVSCWPISEVAIALIQVRLVGHCKPDLLTLSHPIYSHRCGGCR